MRTKLSSWEGFRASVLASADRKNPSCSPVTLKNVSQSFLAVSSLQRADGESMNRKFFHGLAVPEDPSEMSFFSLCREVGATV